MKSTSPRHIIYHGPVQDFTSFIQISAIVCFLCTLSVAREVLHLKRPGDQKPLRQELPFRLSIFVASLCFMELAHALMAHVSFRMTPADLTFDSEKPANWAMKLTFLFTAIIAFVCQTYTTYVVYHLWGCKKRFVWLTMPWVVLALVHGVASSLFGQSYWKFHTLEFYFSSVAVAATTLNTYGMVLGLVMVLCTSRVHGRMNADRQRIWTIIIVVFYLFGAMSQLNGIVHNFDQNPSSFWTYTDIAAYESIGNLYPAFVLRIMTLPGFFKRDTEEDEGAKLPLLQAA